jgi:hypothetical protein
MHVMRISRVPDGLIARCECGKLMGKLERPYHEDRLADIIQGHRQHVLIELEIPAAWRAGSTTQMYNQINPPP